MTITKFDPRASLIIIPGEVAGPSARLPLRLVLDTGASECLLSPAVIDEIGLGAHHGLGRSRVHSAAGEEHGYLIRVPGLRALGFELADVVVNAIDLPDDFGIDGLLGLGFLRNFRYEVRSDEGTIVTAPIPSGIADGRPAR